MSHRHAGFLALSGFGALPTLPAVQSVPAPVLEGVREALQQRVPSPGGNPWLFIGLVLIALTSAYLIGQRRLRAWRRTKEKMTSLGLTDEETALLMKLARRHAQVSVVTVMKKSPVFDSAVRSYLEEMNLSETDQARGNVTEKIESLRTKLGFSQPTRLKDYGTLRLHAALQLEMNFSVGTEAIRIFAKVAGMHEDAVHLESVAPADERAAGKEVQVFFLENNTRYGFKTHVMEMDGSRGRCLLAHCGHVEKAERRRSHRVGIGKPIRYHKDSPTPAPKEATLRDLSAHGVSLTDAPDLKRGDRVILSLQPKEYLKMFPGGGSEPLYDREATAVVVDVGDCQGRMVCHMEFQDLPAHVRDHMHHLVQTIEVYRKTR